MVRSLKGFRSSLLAYQDGAYLFHKHESKRLTFSTPQGWDAGPSQGYPSPLLPRRYPFIHLDEERLCKNMQLFIEHETITSSWIETLTALWPLSPNSSPVWSFIVNEATAGTRVVIKIKILRTLPLSIVVRSSLPIATLQPNFVNNQMISFQLVEFLDKFLSYLLFLFTVSFTSTVVLKKLKLKGAQSRYFELFRQHTKLPLNGRKSENNSLIR